ncbi:hypothetical protein B0H10DRAFT_1064042 [Mycena sp. CBHHK59/15]|nr:hypothetical protein B0H10DRAFT_1064042 [Mycena sp. CBHHK59/15]
MSQCRVKTQPIRTPCLDPSLTVHRDGQSMDHCRILETEYQLSAARTPKRVSAIREGYWHGSAAGGPKRRVCRSVVTVQSLRSSNRMARLRRRPRRIDTAQCRLGGSNRGAEPVETPLLGIVGALKAAPPDTGFRQGKRTTDHDLSCLSASRMPPPNTTSSDVRWPPFPLFYSAYEAPLLSGKRISREIKHDLPNLWSGV